MAGGGPERPERVAAGLRDTGRRVDVGGVEESDAGVQGAWNEGPGLLLAQHPVAPVRRAIGHGAQTDARDLQAGCSEARGFHGESFR